MRNFALFLFYWNSCLAETEALAQKHGGQKLRIRANLPDLIILNKTELDHLALLQKTSRLALHCLQLSASDRPLVEHQAKELIAAARTRKHSLDRCDIADLVHGSSDICQIRLRQIQPRLLPQLLRSMNVSSTQ